MPTSFSAIARTVPVSAVQWWREGDGVQLGGDGINDRAVAVPEADGEHPGQTVDVLFAVGVNEERPFAADPDMARLVTQRVVERVNQMCTVSSEKVGRRRHVSS